MPPRPRVPLRAGRPRSPLSKEQRRLGRLAGGHPRRRPHRGRRRRRGARAAQAGAASAAAPGGSASAAARPRAPPLEMVAAAVERGEGGRRAARRRGGGDGGGAGLLPRHLLRWHLLMRLCPEALATRFEIGLDSVPRVRAAIRPAAVIRGGNTAEAAWRHSQGIAEHWPSAAIRRRRRPPPRRSGGAAAAWLAAAAAAAAKPPRAAVATAAVRNRRAVSASRLFVPKLDCRPSACSRRKPLCGGRRFNGRSRLSRRPGRRSSSSDERRGRPGAAAARRRRRRRRARTTRRRWLGTAVDRDDRLRRR